MMTAPVSEVGKAPRKTALIVEGGAMRGAWAAGVLACLHDRGQRQYDLVYAASSGACSAAYFVAGMLDTSLMIWRDLVCGRKLVCKSNFLRFKPVIDLAYLVDHIFKERVPLSVKAIREAPTKFHIVLTDCETGLPHYFLARDNRIFDALRASASMPLATRGYDFVEGYPFADGGVADPIPIKKAIADGATDITVVLTHDSRFRLSSKPSFLGRWAYPNFPAVAQSWTTRQHVVYNEALDIMRNPPSDVRVNVFRPIKPLQINAFTQAQKSLQEALKIGHQEAMEHFGVSPGAANTVPAVVPVKTSETV